MAGAVGSSSIAGMATRVEVHNRLRARAHHQSWVLIRMESKGSFGKSKCRDRR